MIKSILKYLLIPLIMLLLSCSSLDTNDNDQIYFGLYVVNSTSNLFLPIIDFSRMGYYREFDTETPFDKATIPKRIFESLIEDNKFKICFKGWIGINTQFDDNAKIKSWDTTTYLQLDRYTNYKYVKVINIIIHHGYDCDSNLFNNIDYQLDLGIDLEDWKEGWRKRDKEKENTAGGE